MSKLVKRTIKTARPVSRSELLTALKNAMGPVFEHFEQRLVEGDGKALDIRITANGGKVRFDYGISAMQAEELSAG